MDRRCFCFLLLRLGGSSRRFRFFVTASAVGGVVLLASVCVVRCLFVGRGEPSSATHLRGTGSAGTVPAAAAVANVVASVPVSCPVCLRRCFAGLGDGSIVFRCGTCLLLFCGWGVASNAGCCCASGSEVALSSMASGGSSCGGLLRLRRRSLTWLAGSLVLCTNTCVCGMGEIVGYSVGLVLVCLGVQRRNFLDVFGSSRCGSVPPAVSVAWTSSFQHSSLHTISSCGLNGKGSGGARQLACHTMLHRVHSVSTPPWSQASH